jgi:hypothetical protein
MGSERGTTFNPVATKLYGLGYREDGRRCRKAPPLFVVRNRRIWRQVQSGGAKMLTGGLNLFIRLPA